MKHMRATGAGVVCGLFADAEPMSLVQMAVQTDGQMDMISSSGKLAINLQDDFLCNSSVVLPAGVTPYLKIVGNQLGYEQSGTCYDQSAPDDVLTFCKQKCTKESSCTAFSFKKATNSGQESCLFYSEMVDAGNAKHVGQPCGQLCIRKPATPEPTSPEPAAPEPATPEPTAAP